MIDLHCHTKISDNTLTVAEIISLARNRGISHLAITDHDTTRGLPEAINAGKEQGVEIIPGIEISAYDYKRHKSTHILGFYIEPGHPALEALCSPLAEERQKSSNLIVQRLVHAGYDITWEQVEKYAEGGTGVYKQHIMHALMDKGYCKHIYSPLYKELFSQGWRGKPKGQAFAELDHIDVAAAITAVRAAGGVAVLAHPGHLDNYSAIPELVDYGLQGIEAYHPNHDRRDWEQCLSLAREYDMVVTGGSDFHGFYDEAPRGLGCNISDPDIIEKLKSRAARL